MNCSNCGAPLAPVAGRDYFQCNHCETLNFPEPLSGSADGLTPLGETGEICFSGPQVLIDYVNNPEAYARTVTKEGICYTGDLGYLTEDGLMFSGRAKLVIKPKGYQIHPAQVEEHFALLTKQVQICGAVGAPHDIFSEGVVLFIERKADAELNEAELKEHAQEIALALRTLERERAQMPPTAEAFGLTL